MYYRVRVDADEKNELGSMAAFDFDTVEEALDFIKINMSHEVECYKYSIIKVIE